MKGSNFSRKKRGMTEAREKTRRKRKGKKEENKEVKEGEKTL